MKLFEVRGLSIVYAHPDTDDLLVSDRFGGVYRLLEFGLEMVRYESKVNYIVVNYGGQTIDVVSDGEWIRQKRRAKDSDLRYVRPDGKDADLSAVDKEVVRRYMSLRGDEEAVLIRRKMPDGIYRIFLYQGDASSIRVKVYDGLAPDEPGCSSGALYTYFTNTRTLTLLDDNLGTIWEFHAPGEKAPTAGANYRLFPYKETIVANLSVDHGEQGSDADKNGRIYGLNRYSGAIEWDKRYSCQVNDIAPIDEQRFLATSGNQLLVLSSDNGEVIKAIDTGMPTRDSEGRYLRVYLYMISTQRYHLVYNVGDSGVLQIYDKKTVERLREFDCRDFGFRLSGGSIGAPAYRLIDNKLFLEAVRTDGSEAYLDNLFMIDLDDIYAPIEVEAGPDFDIHLPDEENGCLEFRIEGAEWQEIVRFSERHIIRNLIFVGRGELNEVGNPFFNAVVKLIIRNCLSPRDVLEEKLKVMDNRLKWFFNDKYALHDELLTVEYIIE